MQQKAAVHMVSLCLVAIIFGEPPCFIASPFHDYSMSRAVVVYNVQSSRVSRRRLGRVYLNLSVRSDRVPSEGALPCSKRTCKPETGRRTVLIGDDGRWEASIGPVTVEAACGLHVCCASRAWPRRRRCAGFESRWE